jgi:hypothetical protein
MSSVIRSTIVLFAISAGAVAGASAVVWADVPNSFKSGDTLSAQKINDNFTALDKRVGAFEGHGYCGATGVPVKGGDIGGYVNAATQCKAVCPAASAATARMCTAQEMVRIASAGVKTDAGWISTGESVAASGLYDCGGWTATTGYAGGTWGTSAAAPGPDTTSCINPFKILCCV